MVDKKSAKTEERRFSLAELKEFDGKDRKPAYVAFNGKVYDVTKSKLWKAGRHMDRHLAGDDLSTSLVNAPHSQEVFMKFSIVGELLTEPARPGLAQRIEKLHLHIIVVHFAIAYTLAVSLMAFLYYLTGEASFETASYYLLVLGFLSSIPAGLTGLFSWKVIYQGRRMIIVTRKIVLGAVLIAIISLCFLWRTLVPNILSEKTIFSYGYLALLFCSVPVVVSLGYFGGKLSHP
jgi:predicted heme/steroid binding protein/uncharacterized membrane protein